MHFELWVIHYKFCGPEGNMCFLLHSVYFLGRQRDLPLEESPKFTRAVRGSQSSIVRLVQKVIIRFPLFSIQHSNMACYKP